MSKQCNNINHRILLNDGNSIPSFGLGVYQVSDGKEAENAVYNALISGYIHIDTAEVYQNERSVGIAITRFLNENKTIKRQDLWITTKFFPRGNAGAEGVRKSLLSSLNKLQLDYVDLYLIHAPLNKEKRIEQYLEMEKLQSEGLIRSIGVSNYGIKHLEELLKIISIVPVINQIEINPYITREELVSYCNQKNIVLQAYSPLTKGLKLNDPKLITIAQRYNKTTAQLMIRWCLQKQYVVIPKSSHKERIIENANVFDFDITNDDMNLLDNFDEYLTTGWDPTTID